MRVWRLYVTCLLASTHVAACGSQGRDETPVTVRDSVGVEIVENYSPAWAEGEAWVVGATPMVSIGSLDGDDTHLFTRIDATLLPAGGVAVLDIPSSELRLFDADGGHVVTAGGPGEGPGELQFPYRLIRVRRDSLLVAQSPGRVTLFGPEGRFSRSWSTPPTLGLRAVSEHMKLWGLSSVVSGRYDGYERSEAVVVSTDSLGAVDTLVAFPGADVSFERIGVGVGITQPPFRRAAVAAFEVDRVHVGNGDTWEVATHALADGRLLRVVRRSVEPRPITDESWELNRATYLGSLPEELLEQRGAEIRERLEAAHRLETMPVYDALLADPTGHLWVRPYVPDWETSTDWDVVDPNGRWLGTVRLPPGLDVLEIGEDKVLGTTTDELGVVRLHVHELRRWPPPSP